MTEIELPVWFSVTLVAFTIGPMAATALWVERRFGEDRSKMRKVWVLFASIVGLAVLSVDFLAIKLMAVSS
ncbi:hypothetical protein [Erythrobacter crassostreae]|uniref:Uncharacterized protein n=1 Tax=Erythrobacter crassostreae TaxID=2828328 RepID=A0A9X1F617_9SPHN|nr:hypothetical protein [Erythrobacter crassostrea]MBV7259475.1 hypothetical protein [Erythrobacter crassostrea]